MSVAAASFDLRLIQTPVATLPCVVRGPGAGAQCLIIPPLFEEMNRSRRLLAAIGRRLTALGIGSWLPDLPGTGDSELPSEAMDWGLWRASLAALAKQTATADATGLHVLALRGGALLADAVPAVSLYLLAPVTAGERQLRELMRARIAADQERGTPATLAELTDRLMREPLDLAGYPISPKLADDLRSATLGRTTTPTRIASLSDGTVDRTFEGPPVWRQAEPVAADALALEVAEDIAAWITACASR